MKVIHLIGGGDVGGAKSHVLSLVKELSKSIGIKLISFRKGQFSDDAVKMGIDIGIINSGNFFSDYNELKTILKTERYDIVHCHGSKANMFGSLIKRTLKIPVVTTVHSDYKLDYLFSLPKRLTFGLINTISLRRLDYYVAVSETFKKMLINRGFDEKRIFTVYNGIDFNNKMPEFSRQSFFEKYHLNLNPQDILVGILARLDPVKDISTFVKAASVVVKSRPDVKFIIGGDGPEKENLRKLSQELGISQNVIFAGWINNSFEFMSCININTLTSISESFPYVILEGVRMKTPTISSIVGGMPDLIDNGINGYLFEPENYSELAECILKMVNDLDKSREMGVLLNEKAKRLFSLEAMYTRQLDIYKTILKIS